MGKISLLIVDDHAMFRDGLRAVLADEPDCVVVGEAENAAAAIRLADEKRPDIILMDLQLGGSSGVDATREILANHPSAKVIALTMHEDDNLISAMIQAGAQGYILKDARARELVQAVHVVAAGGAVIDPRVAHRVLEQYRRLATDEVSDQAHQLSPRELEVLHRLAAGDSNRQIANTLYLSSQTVKNILSGIYQKLGVSNRTEAVVRAIDQGIIRRDEET